MDVNEELKIHKKTSGGGGRVEGVGDRVGGGGSGWGEVRVDVNEVIVKMQKKIGGGGQVRPGMGAR